MLRAAETADKVISASELEQNVVLVVIDIVIREFFCSRLATAHPFLSVKAKGLQTSYLLFKIYT